MRNSMCVFLIIFEIFWENQPALAKNCYSSLVGPAKTCSDIFYNEKHANIGVEELKLFQSKHFQCFKESKPGETKCQTRFSDKCLRAILKFEDGSESVFLGCDSKNNSICNKLMTEMNYSEQFGKKLNRKLSVCQHCNEDFCNTKSGITAVTKKILNKDVLAIIKRDADEKSTTNEASTEPPKKKHPKKPKQEPTLPPEDYGEAGGGEGDVPPAEGGKPRPPDGGRPKQEDDDEETSTAKSATKESEPEQKEFTCYQSNAEICKSLEGSVQAYNCMRTARVEEKSGCAVCVTATVMAKGDSFQLAMCEKDLTGRNCKEMSSDWPAEGEHTMGKRIKEVKCKDCKENLCNTVTPKKGYVSQTTKRELPNLLIFILAAMFLTLI